MKQMTETADEVNKEFSGPNENNGDEMLPLPTGKAIFYTIIYKA